MTDNNNVMYEVQCGNVKCGRMKWIGHEVRKLFRALTILTLQSQFFFFLLLRFVCNNKDRHIRNLEMDGRNTSYGSHFHYPTFKLKNLSQTLIAWV